MIKKMSISIRGDERLVESLFEKIMALSPSSEVTISTYQYRQDAVGNIYGGIEDPVLFSEKGGEG